MPLMSIFLCAAAARVGLLRPFAAPAASVMMASRGIAIWRFAGQQMICSDHLSEHDTSTDHLSTYLQITCVQIICVHITSVHRTSVYRSSVCRSSFYRAFVCRSSVCEVDVLVKTKPPKACGRRRGGSAGLRAR